VMVAYSQIAAGSSRRQRPKSWAATRELSITRWSGSALVRADFAGSETDLVLPRYKFWRRLAQLRRSMGSPRH
jgi:hypothetical protein